MNTESIKKLAVERHEIDAKHFQDVYEGINNSSAGKVFLLGRQLVLDELKLILDTIPKGSKILDVGCGTGHLANAIKQMGFEVYGIEPAENMYNYAVQNFPGVEIKKAFSSQIPFPDNYFQFVLAFEVLRYLDKKENILSYKEFYRVLKPGGQFFLTQVNLFSTDFYFIFHHIKSFVYKLLHKPHHYCNFTNAAQQRSIAVSVGFTGIKTRGRLTGSTRIFYKFNQKLGDSYNKLMKLIFKDQRFTGTLRKNLAGHLIVTGRK